MSDTRIGPSTALEVGNKHITYRLKFATDGSGTATLATTGETNKGVYSIAGGSSGAYTITLSRKVTEVLDGMLRTWADDDHTHIWRLTSTTTTSGRTVVVFTHSVTATPTNIASKTITGEIVVRY